jgi:steroid delta-isomerase-like uncharacterized protein
MKRIGIFGMLAALALSLGCTKAEPPPPPPPPPPPAPPPPPPPPPPKGVEVLKKGADLWNAGKTDEFAALFSDDAVWQVWGGPTLSGRQAIKAYHQQFRAGFPDIKVGFSRLFDGGDTVVLEYSLVGTNSAEVMGHKPTGKPVGVSGIAVATFENGLWKKVVEYVNADAIMNQMGAMKPHGPVPAVPALPAQTETVAATPPSTAAQTLKKAYEAWNTNDWKTVEGLLAPQGDYIEVGDGTKGKGAKAFTAYVKSYKTAFPDGQITSENVWTFGNWVVAQNTLAGTNKGKLGKMNATGKPATLHFIEVYRFDGDKAVWRAGYMNPTEMLLQLGVIKPEAPPMKMKAPPVKKKM